MNAEAKQKIRQQMRARRLALSAEEQQQSGKSLAQQARQVAILGSAERIASYRPFDGEIDTSWLESDLQGDVFLPRVIDFKKAHMSFYSRSSNLDQSRLGLDEPASSGEPMSPTEFDIVLVPLVAFKRDGSRLGMGAGFYDRAFAFKQRQAQPSKPVLIGLAHHFQECDELEPDPWDVSLDAIITDREVFHIQTQSAS